MRTLFPCVFLVVLLGCAGGRPAGFPDVKPCSITVTNGAEPLAEVDVKLIPDTPVASTVFTGTTDAAGGAVMGTIFAGHYEKGVPPGTYTVVLKKDPATPHTKSEEERVAMNYDQTMKYEREMEAAREKLPRIVPRPLSKNDSPIKLTVDAAGATLAVDVAEHR